MQDVKANRVADYEHAKNPGDFFIIIEGEHHRLHFLCPCGCGQLGGVNINQADPHAWRWDGNEEAPTISPSILFLDGCKWHGYLKGGVFKTA